MASEAKTDSRRSRERPRRSRLWKIATWGSSLLLVAAILVLVIVAARFETAVPSKGERRLTPVEAQTVRARDYRETLILPGRSEADHSGVVSAEYPARLREWRVGEGAFVESNQVVAILDDQELRATLAELRASQPGARAAEKYARRDLERVRKLTASRITPPSELDRATNALVQAETALAHLERRMDTITVRLAKTRLRAPLPGRLEKHLAQPGERVSAGEPLARVFDFRRIRVNVDVPDRYIPFFDHENEAVRAYLAGAMPGAEPSLAARVELPGMPKLSGGTYDGLVLPAEIHRIAQAADPRSNTFEVTLRLDNPAGALREGMIVRTHLEFLRYPQAVVLPLRAVRMSDGGPRVLIVEDRDGRHVARVRDIDPISVQHDELLIRDGVEIGERLLVVGGRGVIDGEEVHVLVQDGVPVDPSEYDAASSPAREAP